MYSSIHLLLGNSNYHLGEFDSAIKHYRIAVDSVDQSRTWLRSKLFGNLGMAMWGKRDYRGALSCFQRDASPSSGFMGFLCAVALGDDAQYRAEFQRLVSLATTQQNQHHMLKMACNILLRGNLVEVDWLLAHCGEAVHYLVEAQAKIPGVIDGSVYPDALIPASKDFPANMAFLGKPAEFISDRYNECELVNFAVSLPVDRLDEKLDLLNQAASLSHSCWQARFNASLIQGDEKYFASTPYGLFHRASQLKPKLALQIYTALVTSDRFKNDADLLLRISRLHARLGNHERAKDYLSEAQSVDPSLCNS